MLFFVSLSVRLAMSITSLLRSRYPLDLPEVGYNILTFLKVLPNQTWVCSPTCSKANLLTPGWGEGKYSIYCRVPSKEKRQVMLKGLELPDGFHGRGFKGSVRKGATGCMISLCPILGLVGIRVKFQASSTFWFQPV